MTRVASLTGGAALVCGAIVRGMARRALVVLALAFAAAGLAASAAAAPRAPRLLPPPGPTCPGTVIIGARGSGQSYAGFDGLGPAVDRMAIDLRPWLLKKFGFTQTVADPYPADSTNDLKPSRTEELLLLGDPAQAVADYARENLGKFLHSISVGITDAEQEADDSVVDCPQSKLVMMGYSQGAMVIHQTELLLKVDHPATFHHIIGTLLLADGDRVPDTRAHEFGTSLARAEGIQPYLHAIARRDVPLPGNTANICDAGDLVSTLTSTGSGTSRPRPGSTPATPCRPRTAGVTPPRSPRQPTGLGAGCAPDPARKES